MICDALSPDEIYEAYLLYASLHGMSTDPDSVRDRIDRYLDNNPDEVIDDAILAFSEDQVLAPPDVVLGRWGKSRIYELREVPDGSHRHAVCEPWFENGCQFEHRDDLPELWHFWTWLEPESCTDWDALRVGMRLSFQLDGTGAQRKSIGVQHRELGRQGKLHPALARELRGEHFRSCRFLALVDRLGEDESTAGIVGDTSLGACKLLVTVAEDSVDVPRVVVYAARAFSAVRSKC